MLRHMKKHHPNAALPIIPKINNQAHQKVQQNPIKLQAPQATSTASVTPNALSLLAPPSSASQPVIQYHHQHHPHPQSLQIPSAAQLSADSIRHHGGVGVQPELSHSLPPSHLHPHQLITERGGGLHQIPVTIISSNGATNMQQSQAPTNAGNQLSTDHTVVY